MRTAEHINPPFPDDEGALLASLEQAGRVRFTFADLDEEYDLSPSRFRTQALVNMYLYRIRSNPNRLPIVGMISVLIMDMHLARKRRLRQLFCNEWYETPYTLSAQDKSDLEYLAADYTYTQISSSPSVEIAIKK